VPSGPQLRDSFGRQAFSIAQLSTKCHCAVFVSQRLVRTPHLPHAAVGGGPLHTCCIQPLGHWQSSPQTRMPSEPHICGSPGAHVPSPLHVLQVARPVLGSQVLVSVPQLPHERVFGSMQI
jgi:hypothetical protein